MPLVACQHVSFISNICSLKNVKKHENNCCAADLNDDHVVQKCQIFFVPALVFRTEHNFRSMNTARKLPFLLLSMTSKCPSLLSSLSHSLPGKVPLGFLALKGQKQTWSWQATHSIAQGFLITAGRGREQEEAGKGREGVREGKLTRAENCCGSAFVKPHIDRAGLSFGLVL